MSPAVVSAQSTDGSSIATTTATAALSQEQAALAAQIKRVGADPDIAASYHNRGYAPLWTDPSSGARTAALLDALELAPRHALPKSAYGSDLLRTRIAAAGTLPADQRAQLELDMTRTYLRYARDVSSGVLEPRKIDRELYIYPAKKDRGLLLTGLAGASDPKVWFATLPPQDPGYAVLLERYAYYRDLAARKGWGDQLTRKKTLRVGDRASDVEILRARLVDMGYLSVEAATASTADVEIATAETANDAATPSLLDPYVFDPALEAGVTLFQARHGLNQDGAVGPATRAALNVDPGFRAAQLAVNLERRRWLNKNLGDKHILVNLASFDMVVYEQGQPAFESRVVVGKARKHRTPEFSDEMEHMVVNPTWHVPSSIAREEILPALQADPTYLEQKGMRISGVEDPSLIDWAEITPSTFPGRVKQRPGNGNALGRVKFMFPNDHAIYLHDTPSKSLFKRDTRAYSHGCVRVQKPFEFAEYLLSSQRDNPAEYFRTLLDRRSERYVNLDQHVPVHITYRTAWVDSEGNDQFRGDIYGRDRKVLAGLEAAGVSLPAH